MDVTMDRALAVDITVESIVGDGALVLHLQFSTNRFTHTFLGESLVFLSRELEEKAILSDCIAMNREVAAMRRIYQQSQANVDATVTRISQEVKEAVEDLMREASK
jgi:hypothetical protein